MPILGPRTRNDYVFKYQIRMWVVRDYLRQIEGLPRDVTLPRYNKRIWRARVPARPSVALMRRKITHGGGHSMALRKAGFERRKRNQEF